MASGVRHIFIGIHYLQFTVHITEKRQIHLEKNVDIYAFAKETCLVFLYIAKREIPCYTEGLLIKNNFKKLTIFEVYSETKYN